MGSPYVKVHNYYVYYSEEDYSGIKPAIDYLGGYGKYSIDASEASALFEAAKATGSADFEDQSGGNFTIKYDYSNKGYTLEKR